MGFESTHLDGCDLLVWGFILLGYAGLTNNELELLLLSMPLSFASFFFNVVRVPLYSLYFSSIAIMLFNTS